MLPGRTAAEEASHDTRAVVLPFAWAGQERDHREERQADRRDVARGVLIVIDRMKRDDDEKEQQDDQHGRPEQRMPAGASEGMTQPDHDVGAPVS